jgi:hypothetical protein
MSNSERPGPPRRQYPEAYEKALPAILGVLVLALVVLMIVVLVVLLRAA